MKLISFVYKDLEIAYFQTSLLILEYLNIRVMLLNMKGKSKNWRTKADKLELFWMQFLALVMEQVRKMHFM